MAAFASSYHGRQFTLMGGAMYRSFRCLWMLEELGIPYHHVLAMPQSKKIKPYSPLGKIPVLIETQSSSSPSDQQPFVLYESAAINTYLGDLANSFLPDSPNDDQALLVPRPGTHARGLYEQTVSCILTELDAQGLWIHRKHQDMGHVFGHIPDAVTHAKQQFDKTNKVLAQQLQDNSLGHCLVGAHFTAADILYIHCLGWSQAIGWNDQWKDDPNLMEYYKVCTERPAYQKVKAMRTKEAQELKSKGKL